MRKGLVVFACSLAIFVLYLHLYVYAFGFELPKTKNLKRENAELLTRARVLDHELDAFSEKLSSLEMRDEEIYRSIFGLNSVPSGVREAGIGGPGRYEGFDEADRSGNVRELKRRTDILLNKSYVQSRSYDEITLMLQHTDNMSTSIPAISPLVPDKHRVRLSSSFGYRVHPVLGWKMMHRGVDFSTKPGNAVYATGDGVVESIKVEMKGYGRQLVINHGFGYKTRYAHLSTILVTEGVKVKRGEKIALSGNSGLTSGPHLHYEVIYKGRYVNPWNYFDRDFSAEQYRRMVKQVEAESEKYFVHPMHRK